MLQYEELHRVPAGLHGLLQGWLSRHSHFYRPCCGRGQERGGTLLALSFARRLEPRARTRTRTRASADNGSISYSLVLYGCEVAPAKSVVYYTSRTSLISAQSASVANITKALGQVRSALARLSLSLPVPPPSVAQLEQLFSHIENAVAAAVAALKGDSYDLPLKQNPLITCPQLFILPYLRASTSPYAAFLQSFRSDHRIDFLAFGDRVVDIIDSAARAVPHSEYVRGVAHTIGTVRSLSFSLLRYILMYDIIPLMEP